MLSVKNLVKTYSIDKKKGSKKKVTALAGVSIDFPDKGMVFLLGKSGSGKSTLLNCIGGLDTFDSGEIVIKGKSSSSFKQSDFDSYRNTFIGFIFQEYNILEEFTIGKNLSLALELQGKKATKEQVNELLDKVDLSGYYKRKPNQLSGGQKQRVAIARALIKNPEIIMADEPTGALDSATGVQVMDTLKKLSETKLVIVVSHDREFAEIYGDRVIELKDGHIISDRTKTEVQAEKSKSGVSYIGDKLIHISRGQKITKEDLNKIAEKIVKESENDDIIISFDKKSNDQVKKSSFITDDGNQEVFKPTENVETKQYSGNLQLIKSRLKLTDAFKMGVGSLKHKPIRLMFTILLSFIAFCMFGLVDTMASFNVARSLYQASLNEGLSSCPVIMQNQIVYDGGTTYWETTEIYETDIAQMNEEFKDRIILPIYGSTRYNRGFMLGGKNYKPGQQSSGLTDLHFSGVTIINEEILEKFGLKLLEGRLPSPNSEDEVCITDGIFDAIKANYDITAFSQIDESNEDISLLIGNSSKRYKIVGLIDDGIDTSSFTEEQTHDSAAYTLNNYGMLKMIFTTEKVCKELFRGEISYLNVFIESSQNTTSFRPTNIENISREDGNIVTYNGIDLDNLKDNQVLVNKSDLRYFVPSDVEFDDYEEYIRTHKVLGNFYKSYIAAYRQQNAVQFEIVGLFNILEGGSESVAMTKSTYENYAHTYSYCMANFNKDSSDETFISGMLSFNASQNYRLFPYTSAGQEISMFESMIDSLKIAFLYVGIALALFAALMLMNFIATSISYKSREIGVFRAIGARGKDVFAIFFLEAFVICFINFVLATIGCFVAAYFINNSVSGMGISLVLLSVGIRQVALIFAISLVSAFLSSFIPVCKIAKKNPIDSINNR